MMETNRCEVPQERSPIITIPNRDKAAPSLNYEDYVYVSYFENDYGEQMVVVLDKIGDAWLYHSDMGWEAVALPGGVVWNPAATLIEMGLCQVKQAHKLGLDVRDSSPPVMVLRAEELEWLSVCWEQICRRRTCTARQKEQGNPG